MLLSVLTVHNSPKDLWCAKITVTVASTHQSTCTLVYIQPSTHKPSCRNKYMWNSSSKRGRHCVWGLAFIVNFIGLRATYETRVCLWRYFQRRLTEEWRPTMRVGGVFPWTGVIDWRKREKAGVSQKPAFISLCFLIVNVMWPAPTMPSPLWWTRISNCEPK